MFIDGYSPPCNPTKSNTNICTYLEKKKSKLAQIDSKPGSEKSTPQNCAQESLKISWAPEWMTGI